MTLTVNPLLTYSDATTICANQLPYEFHGHVFNTGGTQTGTVQSAVTGCDSTWTLTVNVNPLPTLTVTNKTQTGLIYGDNIQLIEITNTNSNLTVTPAGTYSHIQYNSGDKTISSSNYLAVGTYKFYLQAASDQTPECGTLKDTVTVTVGKKQVTLVSGDATKVYNSFPVTNDDVTGNNANGLVTETGWVGDDGATYTFTGSQTVVGNSPNAFSYTAKTGTDLNNYTIVKTEGTLTVECKEVILTAKSATKTYDGTPLTEPGFTATALEPGDTHTFTVVMTPTSTITYSGYTPNVIGTVDGVDVTTGTQPIAVGNYCVTTVDGVLTIGKKNLILELDSVKVYDGTPFTVTYDQLHVTGLEPGDALVAGNMWSVSGPSVVTDYSGIHVGEYTNNDGYFAAPMEVVGRAEQANFKINGPAGDDDDVTASYVPTFIVRLEIIPRPITITAASDSKMYDGILLVNGNKSITSGALANGDSYEATVSGGQLCKGWSYNTPSNAQVTRGSENVNHDYQISYVKGTLTVTDVDPSQFICPGAETFLLNDCETSTSITIAGEPTVIGIADGQYTVDNDLSLQNPLSEGTHTIHWKLLDGCGYQVGSCEQEVTIEYKACTGVIWQGYPYEAVRIGSQCWFTENLRWNTGSAVAYKDNSENFDKFGYLYTWYTAVDVPEDDDTAVPTTYTDNCGNPYVQGICPPNWGVGSQADYDLLNTTAGSTSMLKDPSTEYWQSGYEGAADGTGFNARGGGWYNSTVGRYEDLMINYHFWNSDSTPGSTISSSSIEYWCDDIVHSQVRKTDKMSVRCVRKVND